jgi:hypothetical protein
MNAGATSVSQNSAFVVVVVRILLLKGRTVPQDKRIRDFRERSGTQSRKSFVEGLAFLLDQEVWPGFGHFREGGSRAPVAQACHSSYSGGRDQEVRGSKPAWKIVPKILKNKNKKNFTYKGWWSGSRCRS